MSWSLMRVKGLSIKDLQSSVKHRVLITYKG